MGNAPSFSQSTYYSNPYCLDITSDRPLPLSPFLLHKLASGVLIRVGWETATCAINEQITNLYFNGSPVKHNVVMKIHQGIQKITATKRYDKDIRARGINGPQAIYSSFCYTHCKVLKNNGARQGIRHFLMNNVNIVNPIWVCSFNAFPWELFQCVYML